MVEQIRLGCWTLDGEGLPVSFAVLTLTDAVVARLQQWIDRAKAWPAGELVDIELWSQAVDYFGSGPEDFPPNDWHRMTPEQFAELSEPVNSDLETVHVRTDSLLWEATLKHADGYFTTPCLDFVELDEYARDLVATA